MTNQAAATPTFAACFNGRNYNAEKLIEWLGYTHGAVLFHGGDAQRYFTARKFVRIAARLKGQTEAQVETAIEAVYNRFYA